MPRDSSSPRSDSSPTDAPPDGAAETELESPLERDQRLLAAWRDGDADRGEALMAHYHGYFLSLCWRYGVRTEEAQLDLYQEILVRLLRVLPRLEISSSFGGYLRRVFHTAVRETKPLAPTPSLPEGAELAGATPSREVEDQEIVAAIEECSEGLADRERSVFVSRLFQERSFTEIAAELVVSMNNLHVIYHRARAKMRACLESKGFRV